MREIAKIPGKKGIGGDAFVHVGMIDASPPETSSADLSPTAYGGRRRIPVRSLSRGLVEPFPAFKNW